MRFRRKKPLQPMSEFPISLGIRLRRAPFGYRREDVLTAVGQLQWQLDTMARSLDRTWRDRVALQGELSAERAEHARQRADSAARLDELQTRLDELIRDRDDFVATLRPATVARRADTRS